MTIVVAIGEHRLAKAIHVDGKVASYGNPYLYDFHEHPIRGLDDVKQALGWLIQSPQCCVIRGAIIDPSRSRSVRRLSYACRKTGYAPTIRACPRHWLALDMDDLPLAAGTDPADLIACATIAVATLPNEFRGARVIVQATGQHGIKPGARLRLWYWLDRPLGRDELRSWLGCTDTSVFSPVQLIYTAAPMFVGRVDHLPSRLAELPGLEKVSVPPAAQLAPPARRRMRSRQSTDAASSGGTSEGHVHVALIRAAERIGSAVEGERHTTLISASCSLLRLIHAGVLAEALAREVLRRAAEAAGWDDPDKISDDIDWALSRQPASPFESLVP